MAPPSVRRKMFMSGFAEAFYTHRGSLAYMNASQSGLITGYSIDGPESFGGGGAGGGTTNLGYDPNHKDETFNAVNDDKMQAMVDKEMTQKQNHNMLAVREYVKMEQSKYSEVGMWMQKVNGEDAFFTGYYGIEEGGKTKNLNKNDIDIHFMDLRDLKFVQANGGNSPSYTDMILATSGLLAFVTQNTSSKIMTSRAGFTSGKLSPNSPKVYNKISATKINVASRLFGSALNLYNMRLTELQYKNGEISDARRKYNHLNNVVGLAFPALGLPIAIGDYFGQKYAQQINDSWMKEGGVLYEPTNAFFNFFFPQKK